MNKKFYELKALLKNKVRQLKKHLSHSNNYSSELINRLKSEIKELVIQLRFSLSQRAMKRILGAGIMAMLGIFASTNATKAQNFKPAEKLPFKYKGTDINFRSDGVSASADLDNDGDQDLLILAYNYYSEEPNGYYYFENNGSQNGSDFKEAQLSPFNLPKSEDFYGLPELADIDGDGDFDLLTLEFVDYEAGNLFWYENTGSKNNPSYGAKQTLFDVKETIKPGDGYLFNLSLGDLDNDGDLDLVSASYFLDSVGIWYFENTGTASSHSFEAGVFNPFNLGGEPKSIDLADFDLDGDLDIMAGDYSSQNFLFYENIGTSSEPNFATSVTNPFGLVAPHESSYNYPSAVDIDGDGDFDLIGGGLAYGELFWYELEGVSSVADLEQIELEIFPNPSSDFINLENANSLQKVVIYHVNGKLVSHHQSNTINIKALPKGNYILKAYFENQKYGFSEFVKN